jgi:hypothetical protein
MAEKQDQENGKQTLAGKLADMMVQNAKEELAAARDAVVNFRAGDGHGGAMWRLGLKELRNAMNPSRESAADTEIGLYGSMTQGEIAQARGSYGLDAEQEKPRENAAQGKEAQEKQGQEVQQQKTSVLGYPLPSQTAQMGGQELSRSRGR